MIEPLFVPGERVRPEAVSTAVDMHGHALVRVYTTVNVATSAAAKYNARYSRYGLAFNVRRRTGDLDDPSTDTYGVYAYKAGDSRG